MAEQPVAAFAARLHVPVADLAALTHASPEQIGVLQAVVERAASSQRHELDRALERAIGFVPRLLRGRARRLVFPESEGG